jgi:hypothetical protein
MAQLSVTKITLDGIFPSLVSADAGGDTFPNAGKTFLWVKNASVAAVDVTIESNLQPVPTGACKEDKVVSVPALSDRMVGPINQKAYNDPTTGEVSISYSAAVSVTVVPVSIAG